MSKYDPGKIEKKWQKAWREAGIYNTQDKAGGESPMPNSSGEPKENFYALAEFPYPSGNLHIGHWLAYAVPDMYARWMRMEGKNVLYPIGFDAFGLPAENAAIKRQLQPEDWTRDNIRTMTTQLESIGAAFDWTRVVSTIDPEYYKWTQWIFIQLYRNGLAYRAKTVVNWCPTDKTVLANEQVVDGKCERDGTPVEQKEITQWMFKITDYADKLVDDLDQLDWPETAKTAQRNWIGRSEGAEIKFGIKYGVVSSKSENKEDKAITVFTTRADTIFGVTYIVLAPEHELITKLKEQITNWAEAEEYIEAAQHKTERERLIEAKEKTGIQLEGVTAINPANGEAVPIWIADYVLAHYGTGAVMAVPAHDERDGEFAKKYNLPITNERFATPEEIAKFSIVKKNYRLHDWVVSRQRYWGVPIPMVHCPKCASLPDGQGYQPVPEDQLPVLLPCLENFEPADDGRSPLARATDWVQTTCPNCGGPAERETDTMDTFVDSSWYFIRYADPCNEQKIADPEKMQAWLPVDIYFGGAEHNTMHLLYSRFITKALYDLGIVPFNEPFTKRVNHGTVWGPDGQKMSKSKGNVVDPDEQVAKYGADTVRMYLAFMGPYDQGGPWDPKGITGVARFVQRVWNLQDKVSVAKSDSHRTQEPNQAVEIALHQAIKNITEDLEQLHFNTCVSELMKLLNVLEDQRTISQATFETFLKILAPFAPHISEELWYTTLNQESSIHLQPWPHYDAAVLASQELHIVVQINGRTRAVIQVPSDADEAQIKELASADAKVAAYLAGKMIKKTIIVGGKLINFLLE